MSRYGVSATPTLYLVDEDGYILFRRYGYLPGEEARLQAKIDGLLAHVSSR